MKILQVKGLKTYFYTPRGIVKAVDNVSFDIEKGEVFGLVGESGSGKTLTALSILGLVPYPGKIEDGEILFNGSDIGRAGQRELSAIRGSKISIVFQDPGTSLDPVFTIGEQMMETVASHAGTLNKSDRMKKVIEYLEKVHIQDPGRVLHDYPHQLSGGIKQRVMIAMALINSPQLLILDEPTTALDVTIQAQVLDLLDEIIKKEALSIIFISHDLGIIARMCNRVAVMHRGKIVESADRETIISYPKDPYTISLLKSVKALSL
ncbi:MAG: ABC transporter ATP-binding protein [Candidatus Omnitrophota bacterium]